MTNKLLVIKRECCANSNVYMKMEISMKYRVDFDVEAPTLFVNLILIDELVTSNSVSDFFQCSRLMKI